MYELILFSFPLIFVAIFIFWGMSVAAFVTLIAVGIWWGWEILDRIGENQGDDFE